MSHEVWGPVPALTGAYEISSEGKVRSVRSGKVLILETDRRGYKKVRVSYNKTKTTIRIHRCVAQVFLKNSEEMPVVNHINGIKSDNRLANLEWCTYSENTKHAVDTGLFTHKSGSEASNFRYFIEVLDMKMRYLYTTAGNKELLSRGFDPRSVNAVVLGKRKSHKGHIFNRREM